jgi:hypothetical protein
MTLPEINRIVDGFKNHTLPKEEWTHKHHVLVATWYLLHFTTEETIVFLRQGIKSYNESTGGRNSDTEGYHETITLFWIYKINAFIQNHKNKSIEGIMSSILEGDFIRTNSPLQYYSEGQLMSVEARKNWMEPDLKSLERI